MGLFELAAALDRAGSLATGGLIGAQHGTCKRHGQPAGEPDCFHPAKDGGDSRFRDVN